ncbi:quinone oxidoreductase family protein [Rhodococcus aerolatus]
MHAIVMSATGGPEVLQYSEVEDPRPGPGEVVVAVAAAGVNFIDTYRRDGTYPVELPHVPGVEGAGAVVELGEGVTGLAVGDRVAWSDAPGSYAERVVLAASRAVRVPDLLPDAEAASVLLQGMTAHYLIASIGGVQAGDTVLVHAGAGGTGLVLTQLAVARGVRVITTASSAEKAELSRGAGAAEVLRYDDPGLDLAAAVRDLTDGEGVAVVYDGVGASTFDASLASLRRRGTLALFGAASGPVPPVDPQRLNAAGSVFLTRPTLAHYVADDAEMRWRAGEVLDAVADGSLSLRVGHRYPLAEAEQAHRDLQARATTGSLVLLPQGAGD